MKRELYYKTGKDFQKKCFKEKLKYRIIAVIAIIITSSICIALLLKKETAIIGIIGILTIPEAIAIYFLRKIRSIEKYEKKQIDFFNNQIIKSEQEEIIKSIELYDEIEEAYKFNKKYLLTKNEYNFYKKLKIVAEETNKTILAKIRLADLIEPTTIHSPKEQYALFQKIKAKHIDFAICNPENLFPEIIIELNDKSHINEKRVERDLFVENALNSAGYKILFLNSEYEIETKLKPLIVGGVENCTKSRL